MGSSNKTRLGYESTLKEKCGKPVELRDSHCVITGVTQESGKTTTLEAISQRAANRGKKVLVFVTKQGEGGFQNADKKVEPYFKDEVDWEYVVQILETAMNKSMDFNEPWIINAVDADKYQFLDKAETLEQTWDNIQELLHRHRSEEYETNLRSLTESVYTSLDKYFEKVVPQIEQARLSTDLDLEPGVNVMDLSHLSDELQSLIIGKTTEKIEEDETDVIEVIPEAWKFLPQGKGSPCKAPVESLIRQGATNDNYVWVDSQDITGMAKPILKQVNNWVLGYQKEKNEVDRTRDQMGKRRAPSKEAIMDLNIGEFFVCDKSGITKTYVDPIWIGEVEVEVTDEIVERAEELFEEENVEREVGIEEGETYTGIKLAKKVACQEISSEAVKEARKQQMAEMDEEDQPTALGEDGVEEEETEEPEQDKETLERKVSTLEERIESLKQQVDTYEETVENKEETIEELEEEKKELENRVENQEREIDRLRNSQDSKPFEGESDNDSGGSPIKDVIQGESKDKSQGEESVEPDVGEEELQEVYNMIEELQAQVEEVSHNSLTSSEVEDIVDNRIEDVKDSMVQEESPVENVLDDVMENFQENAVSSIMSEVDQLSNNQKKMILYLESRGRSVGSKKKLVENALGWSSYGSTVGNQIDQLVEKGFMRKDAGGNLFPEMREKVENELDGYAADEEEVNETYNKAIAKINQELEE